MSPHSPHSGSEMDDEEYDDCQPKSGKRKKPDWRRHINVGPKYQATIPDYIGPGPMKTCRKKLKVEAMKKLDPADETRDILLWKPTNMLSDEALNTFIRYYNRADGCENTNMQDINSDCDHALYHLFTCGNSIEKAVTVYNAIPNLRAVRTPIRMLMEPWSQKECFAFENGLRSYGKSFPPIASHIPTRSLGEVISFYYFWKKTERADYFVQQHGPISELRPKIKRTLRKNTNKRKAAPASAAGPSTVKAH